MLKFWIGFILGWCLICANMLFAFAQPSGENKMSQTEIATFAGGCFWCMQPPFDKTPGVISTTVGYTGGRIKNPTYQQVSSGSTGHLESIQVEYNPAIVSYEKLLDVFWHNIDPLDATGQFCDKGDQYRSIIFYHSPSQQQQAQASKEAVSKQLDHSIATDIVPANAFYRAEDYHQKYYEKNPLRYKFYRYNCGRDKRLKEVWR